MTILLLFDARSTAPEQLTEMPQATGVLCGA